MARHQFEITWNQAGEKRAALQRSARAGRVSVGPWNVLNDEFFASGEALDRYILHAPVPCHEGRMSAISRRRPRSSLASGSTTRSSRGMHLDKRPRDGVLVGVTPVVWCLHRHGASWYKHAQRFPIDEALGFVEDLRDRMTPVSRLDCLLLMNGVDHIEAQSEAPVNSSIAEGERLALGANTGAHLTLSAYVDAAKESIRTRLRDPHGRVRGRPVREPPLGDALEPVRSISRPTSAARPRLRSYAEPETGFLCVASRGGVSACLLTYA